MCPALTQVTGSRHSISCLPPPPPPLRPPSSPLSNQQTTQRRKRSGRRTAAGDGEWRKPSICLTPWRQQPNPQSTQHAIRRLERERRARSLHCVRSPGQIPLNKRANARPTRRRSHRAEHIGQPHPFVAQLHRCRRCPPLSPMRYSRVYGRQGRTSCKHCKTMAATGREGL